MTNAEHKLSEALANRDTGKIPRLMADVALERLQRVIELRKLQDQYINKHNC
jgi:CHAD domain-containing protein